MEKAAFSRDSKRTVAPKMPLIPVTVPSAKARATTETPMNIPPTRHSAGENTVTEGSPMPPANDEAMVAAQCQSTAASAPFRARTYRYQASRTANYSLVVLCRRRAAPATHAQRSRAAAHFCAATATKQDQSGTLLWDTKQRRPQNVTCLCFFKQNVPLTPPSNREKLSQNQKQLIRCH